MNREERVFIETYRDLQTRLRQCRAYDLLLSSMLVRKLLLDGTPLYVAANRSRRLKLSFPCNTSPICDSSSGAIFRGFGNCPRGSIDKFLSTQCLYLEGNVYTAHELIDVAAHKHGGVHFSAAVTTKERLLVDWQFEDHGIRLMGGGPENPMLFLLHQIGLAVVDSLGPLADAIDPPKRSPTSFWRRLFQRLVSRRVSCEETTSA